MKKISISIIGIILFFVSCNYSGQEKSMKGKQEPSVSDSTNKLDSIVTNGLIKEIIKPKVILVTTNNIRSSKIHLYRLRKYNSVSLFYSRIAKAATELCMEKNVPPAAVLAIAGLESGWNQGYVGRITGNILSLGTRRGDEELPALRLPRHKITGKIIFDSLEIQRSLDSNLVWKKRPPSLKKDYRPEPFTGSKYNLGYFKNHPKQRDSAQIANLNDFVTKFISRKSRIKAYRESRHLMDSLVNVHGKQILLKEETAISFINAIGGRKNTFNFRKTWPKKVISIIKLAGLEELTTELYLKDVKFDDIW